MNTHGATVNRCEIVSMYAGLKMREIKLRMQDLQGARRLSRAAHAEPCHFSEGCHNNVGVTAGKASHNASNARDATADKMGRNSSRHNQQYETTEVVLGISTASNTTDVLRVSQLGGHTTRKETQRETSQAVERRPGKILERHDLAGDS